MKVFIGADHRGFNLKEKIVRLLQKNKHFVVDLGADNNKASYDYPKAAYRVARHVAKAKGSRGILVCLSGIGQAIAANKVRGAYAALCYNPQAALLSRRHNNSNILVLGAKFVRAKDISKIINVWLKTEFEGGRHKRRFNQIRAIEK